MSFDEREISNQDGQPNVLYEFRRQSAGTLFRYTYTSADADIPLGGDVYVAMAISDEGINQGDSIVDDYQISLPATADIPQMFRLSQPTDPITLVVRILHDGEQDFRTVWAGVVSSCKFVGEAEAQLTCNTLTNSFQRGGLRLTWSRSCPHVLYDNNCRADPSLFTVQDVVSEKNGIALIVPAAASQEDGYFSGGMIRWVTDGGFTEQRTIMVHVGDRIDILGSTALINVGDEIHLFAGCTRTRVTCNNRFNNIANYGGFPYQPGKSPFDGDPVF